MRKMSSATPVMTSRKPDSVTAAGLAVGIAIGMAIPKMFKFMKKKVNPEGFIDDDDFDDFDEEQPVQAVQDTGEPDELSKLKAELEAANAKLRVYEEASGKKEPEEENPETPEK